jgi:tyrosine-specific transport protein
MNKHGSTLGGTLLVAGTSIGGGMLALPVLTSLGGFVPSLLIYVSCWLFMACTGLLFLEVTLWLPGESNIVSMANRTLGLPGKIFAWGLYIFLFYCLTLAYIVGCGDLTVEILGNHISPWVGSAIFLALFGPLVYAGTKVVGKLNVVLMIGLGLSFLIFVALGIKYVDRSLLTYQNWSLALLGLPIAFTSFAYQGIIPTLVHYLDRDVKKIRTAILVGSFIPLLTYTLWQWLILGIVPTNGPHGLAETLKMGETAVYPLKFFIQNPLVYTVGQFFAFFALVTSFFGVTLGLVDFLADGLQVKKTAFSKLYLCLLVFAPPFFIALSHPHIFLQALDFAGGFGCALLLGLLPIAMVWVGRYRLGLTSSYQLPGGKVVLCILFIFVVFELLFEIGSKICR